MAAAEYYNIGPIPVPQASPYQQAQRPQGSPVPPGFLSQAPQYPNQPPPYQAAPQEHKPSVHFASSPRPPQAQHTSSYSNQVPMPVSQNRPSFSNQSTNLPLSNPQAYPPQPNSYHGITPGIGSSQQASPYPPHMRPYMNNNASQNSLGSGYSSEPEPHRRRHRRREHSDDREIRERPHKHRSRSTNTDGLLGATGGGLIGDMIFPGLGTVGGALAGWIGGKDYGKHRKHREERREEEQEQWEKRHRRGSHSGSHSGDGHSGDQHHHDRHRSGQHHEDRRYEGQGSRHHDRHHGRHHSDY